MLWQCGADTEIFGWRTFQPRTFQPQASTPNLSTPDFSSMKGAFLVNNWMMEIMDSQCQNVSWYLGWNYPQRPKMYSTDLSIWPKSLGYFCKKALLGIHSLWDCLRCQKVLHEFSHGQWKSKDIIMLSTSLLYTQCKA